MLHYEKIKHRFKTINSMTYNLETITKLVAQEITNPVLGI